MKAALYVRVPAGNNGRSLEFQETALREWCRTNGYEALIFRDRHSAFDERPHRPEFRRLIQEARYGSVTALAVTSLDRFSREPPSKVFILLDDLVRVSKVRFVSLSEGIDSASSSWKPAMAMMAWVAGNHSALHGETVRRGMERAKRLGTRTGRLIGRPRRLEPELGSTIRALRAAGESWGRIARLVSLPRSTVRYLWNGRRPNVAQDLVVEAHITSVK